MPWTRNAVAAALLAAALTPLQALARDDGFRGSEPGADNNPGEMDKALGVTVPVGKQPKSDRSMDDRPVDCGETVTTTLDASGNMVEKVTPKPCN